MTKQYARRRFVALIIALLTFGLGIWYEDSRQATTAPAVQGVQTASTEQALAVLDTLPVKGRAPKTGYERSLFGSDWGTYDGCSVRELILARDMQSPVFDDDGCSVVTGTLQDPYTNKTISFVRGPQTSQAVQIDHVVALSDAWQKGAQALTPEQRRELYNDPLNLLAVDGPTNNDKGDADAATWLPPNKDYRCRYVARQIAVKQKYSLWVSSSESDAMRRILQTCPTQQLPIEQ